MFIKAVFKTTFGLSDVLNLSPRNGHVILVTLAYIEGWTVVQSYGDQNSSFFAQMHGLPSTFGVRSSALSYPFLSHFPTDAAPQLL